MKKFCFLSLLLFFGTFTFGQKLDLGLGISPHIGWLTVDIGDADDSFDIANNGAGIGISFGIIADILSDNYGFNTGLLYTIIKGKSKPVTADTTKFIGTEHVWNVHYFELPLALKLKTQEYSSGLTFFGRFGFAPQFKISEALELEEISEEAKFMNFSLLFGGGINYALGGNTRLLLGLSFRSGMIKVNKLDNYDVKSSYISIDTGILF